MPGPPRRGAGADAVVDGRGAARTSTGGRAGGVARPGDAARRPGARAGAIAAAANKLEAALRREKLGGAADDALRRARQGQPFESEEPPAKKRRRDPRTRRERKLSIDYDDVGDDAMEVEEEDLEMPPPAEPPKDDRALSAQAAGRLVAGARGPRAAAAPVPDAHRARLREGAAARCLAAPAETVAGEKRFETRDAIVARLARGEACDQPEGVARVLRRAVADKKSRRDGLELGLRVLFELYAREKRGAARDAYDRCLLALLGALRDGLDAEERKLLAEAALGAPRLPDAAIAFLGDLCESPDHVALGLGALRDVATRRPAARDRCLRRALELTRRPDVAPEVREKAVRLATNQLWPNAALRETVVAFARARLETAAREGPEGRAGDGGDALAAARRELALVVALCVKDASLVPDVVRAAAATADAPDDARRATTRQACEAELPKLAPALATVHGAKPTLEHAADALGGDLSPRRRDATEALLRSLVAALATGRGARAPQLWEGAVAVRARARRERGSAEEDDGVEFLTPALGAATAAEVEAALPSLLRRLDDAQLGAAFRRAVQTHAVRARRPDARALFYCFPPPVRDAPPGPRAGQGVEVDHGPGGRGPPGEAAPRPGGRRARQAPERGAQRLPEPARRVRAAGAPGRAGPHDAAAGLGRRGARGRAEGVPADVHPGRQDAPGAARRAGRAARAPAAGRRGRLARRGPVEGLPHVLQDPGRRRGRRRRRVLRRGAHAARAAAAEAPGVRAQAEAAAEAARGEARQGARHGRGGGGVP